MAFINPVTDDSVSWTPSASLKSKVDSYLLTRSPVGATEETALTITPPNNATYDFRATIVGRATGKYYRADLRAAYDQTSGTWTVVEAPSVANEIKVNCAGWTSRFERSGSNVLVNVTGESGAVFSVETHAQIVSAAVLNGGAGIDPATLSLTGFWQDFASAPWSGLASAGASLNRTLVVGATPDAPSVGPNFGVHPSAQFNGTSEYLDSAITADNYFSESAYTIEVVCEFSALGAANQIYEEPLLFGCNTSLYIAASTSGIRVGHFNQSTGAFTTGYLALPPVGTKLCVQAKFEAGKLKIRVNGGSWEETDADDCDVIDARTLRTGANYDPSTKFFNGRIARIFTANTALSDTTLDGTYAHAKSNFGVP